MSPHDLAMAAAKLAEEECLSVFAVPGCAPRDAVDRPRRAYLLFLSRPAAQFIGVPTGVQTMIVAIVIEAAWKRWFRHNFGRFPATLVHRMPGGELQLIFRMPLPPAPIISRGSIVAGVEVMGEDCWTWWPAPPPYQGMTPGCVAALEVPIAALPKWIIDRVTAEPRPKEPPVLRLPRRGIDVIRDRVVAFTKYSRQGNRAEVLIAAAQGAARWIGQGALEEAEVLELLVGAAVEAGLAPDEALAAARRGLKVGNNGGLRNAKVVKLGDTTSI